MAVNDWYVEQWRQYHERAKLAPPPRLLPLLYPAQAPDQHDEWRRLNEEQDPA